VYARTAANTNYNAGAAQRSVAINTAEAPVPAIAMSSTGLTGLKVGQAVSGAAITYTLANGTYASSIIPANFAVSNLPPGLTAGTAARTSGTVVTVSITGTPTTYNASTRVVTLPTSIPQANVSGATAAITPTGTVSASAVSKGDGAAVSGAPTVSGTPTQTSITVNTVTIPTNPGSQTVEYAISTTTTTPSAGWQAERTFNDLTAGTTYYVYARTAANTNYNAGTAQISLPITIVATGINDLQQVNTLQAWVQNHTLNVRGLKSGKMWRVYTILGGVIYQGIASGDAETVHTILLPNRGVYIVVSGNNAIKISD
jgi:hypothetical protein